MPAVVRVKRRIDEEPLSAFLLNGKKRRVEDGGGEGEVAVANNKELLDNKAKDEISTVLKFAGTINEQNDTTQIIRLTKDAAKDMVQQRGNTRVTNHTDRMRNELRQSVRDQRYRVVNCMRTTVDAATAANEITIVDIEEDKSTAKKNDKKDSPRDAERPSDSDTGYVYDLYLPENEQLVDDVDLTDNYLSFRAFNELVYEDCYQDEENSDDSEDSNQENYYTNDYPDENSDMSSSQDDEVHQMVDAIERFVIEDDEEEAEENFAECSSDDEDERRFYFDSYLDPNSTANDEFVDDVDDIDEEEENAYDAALRRYNLYNRRAEYDEASRNSDGEDNHDENALEEAFHSASENGDGDNN